MAPVPVAAIAPSAAPSPAASCAGVVQAPEGLREVDDAALLKQAVADPGKGGLCAGKVFEAVRPVTVFRVWNRAKVETALGRWWSFAKPQGPVDAYRRANAICPEWSELNYANECHLKVGARVVVGPGQSADCKGTPYDRSATNQVFVPNDTRDANDPKLFVEGCSSGAIWP